MVARDLRARAVRNGVGLIMHHTRCFVSPAAWNESEICLSPEEEHHLLDVLRARLGDTVVIFDGQGREAQALLVPAVREPDAKRKRGQSGIALRVVKMGDSARPPVSLTLAQALPKGQRMDWIVEKAAELGASVILPIVTERVVTRLTEKQKVERRDRWNRVALSAAKQCGRNWVPEIRPVCNFADAIPSCSKADLFLVGALTPDTRLLRTILEESRARNPHSIALLIGPEGDLTPSELVEAQRAGAVPVSFGTIVLRVETAALFGLSVLASEFLCGAHTAPNDLSLKMTTTVTP